ncbi:MAG: hypothetical protein ACTSRF_02210 [Candidatus Freyarchaeota archaeon]
MHLSNPDNKVKIQIDSIRTPAGDVPTVDSLKRVVDGLNILNSDIDKLNVDMARNMSAIDKELRNIRKLIAEETVSFEVMSQKLEKVSNQLERLAKSEKEKWDTLQEIMIDVGQILKGFQATLEEHSTRVEKRINETLKALAEIITITVKEEQK